METRHPVVEGSFGSEFPAICNHCGVTVAWSHKTLRFVEEFLRFLDKMTPYGEIFKIMFRKFWSQHQSTLLCSNFVIFVRQKISEIVRYLVDKKTEFRLSLKLSLLRGSRPKSARASRQQYTQSAADFIQIGSVQFRRSYSRTREHRPIAP